MALAGIWTQPNNSTCHTVNHNAMCTTVDTNLTNTSVGGGYVNLKYNYTMKKRNAKYNKILCLRVEII